MKMSKIRLYTWVAISAGIPLLSGCFSNGAAYLDSKCSSFSSASVSKTYFIDQIQVEDEFNLLGLIRLPREVRVDPNEKKPEGKTFFAGNKDRGRKFVRWLDAQGPFGRNFATTRTGGDEPISIKAVITKKNANGAIAKCNNFLSSVTLNIWPWYHSADVDYRIEVESPTGIKDAQFRLQERSLTSWLPLALCPVPAWADYRDMSDNPVEESLEAEQVGRCVVSLLAEKSNPKSK